MNTLVRKDLRLLRPLLLFAAGLAGFLYLLPVAFELAHWLGSGPPLAPPGVRTNPYNEESLVPKIAYAVFNGTQFVWLSGGILLPAVGAMAFALERRERWADFAAVLPVSRGGAVRAKLIASAIACAAMAWTNELVTIAASVLRQVWPRTQDAVWPQIGWLGVATGILWLNYRRPSMARLFGTCSAFVFMVGVCTATTNAYYYAAFGTTHGFGFWFWGELVETGWGGYYLSYLPLVTGMFGTAWLLSSLTRSPALATAVAVAAFGGAYLWVVQAMSSSDLQFSALLRATLPLRVAAAVWGVLAVAAGVVVQLKRPTP